MTHTFTIPGEPVGKGRPRFSGTKNGRVHTYTPDKTAKYEKLVRKCWKDSVGKSFGDAPVAVDVYAYFPIPKSYSQKQVRDIKAGKERPTKKPDRDNIVKIILDALNGLAYDDDKQVVDGRCVKLYAVDNRPRVVVAVYDAPVFEPDKNE